MSETAQPLPPGALEAADVTLLERATIQKLRWEGWWRGDPHALEVLREFAAKVREESCRP